jgi:hypothetical protein
MTARRPGTPVRSPPDGGAVLVANREIRQPSAAVSRSGRRDGVIPGGWPAYPLASQRRSARPVTGEFGDLVTFTGAAGPRVGRYPGRTRYPLDRRRHRVGGRKPDGEGQSQAGHVGRNALVPALPSCGTRPDDRPVRCYPRDRD